MPNAVVPDAHKTIRFCAIAFVGLVLGWRVVSGFEAHQQLLKERCPTTLTHCLAATATAAVSCARKVEQAENQAKLECSIQRGHRKQDCDAIAKILGYDHCY